MYVKIFYQFLWCIKRMHKKEKKSLFFSASRCIKLSYIRIISHFVAVYERCSSRSITHTTKLRAGRLQQLQSVPSSVDRVRVTSIATYLYGQFCRRRQLLRRHGSFSDKLRLWNRSN